MEARAAASRERANIDHGIKKLIQAIKDGVPGAEVRDEMIALQARKGELENERTLASEVPPLLHPHMADVWRAEITELRAMP